MNYPYRVFRPLSVLLLVLLCTVSIKAADYTIEVLKEGPPADELAKEIADEIADTGYAVKRSETSTLCNIWFCKEWKAAADFKPSAAVLYPFTPGQLIGVVEYKRRGEDFREQDLNRGVYTLRYALQPVDGNHVGTSATRDFLLVVTAENDKSPEAMDIRELYTASSEAAESSHPGLLLMQEVPADADTSKPSIKQNDDEWWIARLIGQVSADGKTKSLAIDLVVEGHADE